MTTSETTVLIGSDHAGCALKNFIQRRMRGIDWVDVGPESMAVTVDYPVYAHKLCARMLQHPNRRARVPRHGILICASGVGMCVAANRFPWIRAVVGHRVDEITRAVEHTDVNVLCLSATTWAATTTGDDDDDAPCSPLLACITAFLGAAFDNDSRHCRRLQLLSHL